MKKTNMIERWLKRALSLVSLCSYINVNVDDRKVYKIEEVRIIKNSIF